MGNINFNSIETKLNSLINSSKGVNYTYSRTGDSIAKLSDQYGKIAAEVAGDVFKGILEDEINKQAIATSGLTTAGGGLGDSALDALLPIEVGEAFLYDDTDPYYPQWGITVNFPLTVGAGRGRASLNPKKYPEGIDNLPALLNNGIEVGNPEHGTVSGMWHGRYVKSLPEREGADFVRRAVDIMKNSYEGLQYLYVDEDFDVD